MSEPLPVREPIQVRWRDLDPLGHVNNAVYATYFEAARLAYMRALFGEPAPVAGPITLPANYSFIVAELHCRYRAPVTLGTSIEVTIYVSQVGRKSFVFEYQLLETGSGRLLADGCTTQVWYDYHANHSCPVPATVVARMEELQQAPIPRSAPPAAPSVAVDLD